jgi:hypothetical protein
LDTVTSNVIQLDLQLPASLVDHTLIWVKDNSGSTIPGCGAGPVTTPHYIEDCTVPATGRYIVQLYTDGASDDANPYTLEVTFN